MSHDHILVQCLVTIQGLDMLNERSIWISGNRFKVSKRSVRADKGEEFFGKLGHMAVGEYPFRVHQSTQHVAVVSPRGHKKSMGDTEVAVPQRYIFPEHEKEQAGQARSQDVESELVKEFVRSLGEHDAAENEEFSIPENVPPATFLVHKCRTEALDNPNRERLIRLALIAGDDPNEYFNALRVEPADQNDIEAVRQALLSSLIKNADPMADSMYTTVGEGSEKEVGPDLSKA